MKIFQILRKLIGHFLHANGNLGGNKKAGISIPQVESVNRCYEKSQLIGKTHSNCFAFFSNLLTYILCLTNVLRIQHKVAWD